MVLVLVYIINLAYSIVATDRHGYFTVKEKNRGRLFQDKEAELKYEVHMIYHHFFYAMTDAFSGSCQTAPEARNLPTGTSGLEQYT